MLLANPVRRHRGYEGTRNSGLTLLTASTTRPHRSGSPAELDVTLKGAPAAAARARSNDPAAALQALLRVKARRDAPAPSSTAWC